MNTIQTITLNKLVPSKANVRRTGAEEGIEELAQSIAAHGLRQNLNVRETDKGRFEVVAGGRRLRALKLLVKEGLMAKDADIPCKLLGPDEDAAEISLVENTLRVAMHPDDQFEAFQQLVDAGKGVEEVAARFGVTPAVVERRLKLAKVSPKLRAAFREGNLTLDQMMAFTVSDDHGQQEEVFANLSHWNSAPADIRAVLTQEAVDVTHPLARFVTVEAYVAAGGVIQRDLFATVSEGYMADRGLALRLASEKLDAACGNVEAEGWKWVKTEVERVYSLHYGRVYPQWEEPEDGEEGEATYRYDADDIARAGAIVRVGPDGSLTVERGLIHPDDVKRESRGATAAEPSSKAAIPASVVKELSAHRTAALQAALAQNPAVALAVTVATLALPLVGGYSSESCLQMGMKRLNAAEMVTAAMDCDGHTAMAEEAAMWSERLPTNPADLLGWCLGQSQDTLLSLLAYCAASSVNAVRDKFDGDTTPRLVHADTLAASLNLDMVTHWAPSVEGFYGKLSKDGLITVAKDASVTLSLVLGTVKKLEAAKHVMTAMAGSGWLPPVMRGRSLGEVARAVPLAEAA
jgi:ParB family chromosome partitioning protein